MLSSYQLRNCTYVKTILMVIVIIGHSIVFWKGTWIATIDPVFSAPVLATAYDWINSFHIFAFTLVSGYLFAFKMNGGGYSNYKKFIILKAKRLLVPYAFVAFAWVAPINVILFKWDLTTFAKRILLAINPNQLWFLWMLFWVFAIVWLLWKIITNSFAVSIVISILCYGISLVGGKLLPNVFCFWTGIGYIPYFVIGVWIREKHKEDKFSFVDRISWYWWIISHTVLFVGYTMLSNVDAFGLIASVIELVKIAMQLGLHCVGAIMGYAVLQKIADSVKWNDSKSFMALSNYTMPMYLFHQQLIYFSIMWLNGRVNPYINAIINFLFAFFGSLIISIVLKKWRTTRFLIGEKH